MVACYSMATAAFCQKAVVVGKVAPRSFEAASRLVAFRFQGLERKPFVDGYTNKNYPKYGICLRHRLIGKRQFNSSNLDDLKKTHS